MHRQKTNDPPKEVKKYGKCERMNLTLPSETSKKLNAYVLAVVNKQGKIPHGIKTKIGEMAVAEWLDKHHGDTEIQFK